MQVLRDRVAAPENLFYCPGSLLQNEFDPNHPVAWGMPAAWPIFFESDQAYRLRPGFGIETEVAARYPRQNILQSGWLLGEGVIAKKAAAVAVRHGKGRVVLIGFRPQHRDQTHGTFKLVFNAVLNPPPPSSSGSAQ